MQKVEFSLKSQLFWVQFDCRSHAPATCAPQLSPTAGLHSLCYKERLVHDISVQVPHVKVLLSRGVLQALPLPLDALPESRVPIAACSACRVTDGVHALLASTVHCAAAASHATRHTIRRHTITRHTITRHTITHHASPAAGLLAASASRMHAMRGTSSSTLILV